jgi:hypothetical protein
LISENDFEHDDFLSWCGGFGRNGSWL